MKEESNEYHQLFKELTAYERTGVKIKVEGSPASPMQVITAHLVQEENTYMRDYVLDEQGKLKELCFHNIKND